jgi:hypothetical protein
VLLDEVEPVSVCQGAPALCRSEDAPLGESGGAVQLEVPAGVKAALGVEVVADAGMDGGELLQTSLSISTAVLIDKRTGFSG